MHHGPWSNGKTNLYALRRPEKQTSIVIDTIHHQCDLCVMELSIPARKLWDLPHNCQSLWFLHLNTPEGDRTVGSLHSLFWSDHDTKQFSHRFYVVLRTSSVAICIGSSIGEWAQGHRNPKRSSPCSGSSLVPSAPRCSLPSPKFNRKRVCQQIRTAQSRPGPSCLECSGVKAKSKLERCAWRT